VNAGRRLWSPETTPARGRRSGDHLRSNGERASSVSITSLLSAQHGVRTIVNRVRCDSRRAGRTQALGVYIDGTPTCRFPAQPGTLSRRRREQFTDTARLADNGVGSSCAADDVRGKLSSTTRAQCRFLSMMKSEADSEIDSLEASRDFPWALLDERTSLVLVQALPRPLGSSARGRIRMALQLLLCINKHSKTFSSVAVFT
jgi:hypothetical protein